MGILIFLTACGGESSPSSGESGERLLPTPTIPTATPVPEPTATPPAPGAGGGTFPLPANPPRTELATTEATETPTRSPSPTPATRSFSSEEDIAAIRQIVEAYWEAFNDYDVGRAITMLEPAYREVEEELIRRDIGRMKLFRAKLEVSEESPPTLNIEGDYETFVKLKTPVDTRLALMIFRRINGQWWIIYSDEVE